MAAPVLEVTDLTKSYAGRILANDKINLSVAAGESVGLLGRNGAGKTTLVRQITGLLRPTSGRIVILGEELTKSRLRRLRRRMGVVPQDATPYHHLSATEHLTLFARLYGLSSSEAHDRCERLIEAIDLGAHANKPSQDLSGGLQRKLLIALAMVGDPELLILDEPTTGLDPHSRRQVWEMIQSVIASGATVLMTSHYMEEVEQLCSRIAIIHNARIIAEGPLDHLRSLAPNRVRATYAVDGTTRTVFGGDIDEVQRKLAKFGVTEYSIGMTTLEDVYLQLTQEEADFR